jgi:hypothetical protein
MADHDDKLTTRLNDCIEAATVARSHLAPVGDPTIRAAAEKIIDELLRNSLHDAFAPLFKNKKKKKK